jgi:hypothetical protein
MSKHIIRPDTEHDNANSTVWCPKNERHVPAADSPHNVSRCPDCGDPLTPKNKLTDDHP